MERVLLLVQWIVLAVDKVVSAGVDDVDDRIGHTDFWEGAFTSFVSKRSGSEFNSSIVTWRN